MSENDKNNGMLFATDESVDDILAGILNPDGTFNDEFNTLLARYVGGGQVSVPVPDVDLSDRSDERAVDRPEYDVGRLGVPDRRTADERITDKIPEGLRGVYTDASSDARRPEFTSTGDVRYPTMGVGEAEERVVYDADWEETARKEAARLERVRQDRMLRGDSTYARTFVAGGMFMQQRNPYIDAPGANPLYIDPLSGDEDFESADETSAYYNSNKKPFFPEGFSAPQKNNSVAGGKTVKNNGNGYVNKPVRSDAQWLQIDDKSKKKKKHKFGKKKAEHIVTEKNENETDSVLQPEAFSEAETETTAVRVSPFAGEDINEVRSETNGLRSTVAQIVDKYNKRSEEEIRKKLEEEVKQEELRREEELRERRRQEEIRLMKKDMSPELCLALDSEENTSFEEYDDFSTVPAEKKPETEKKVYGVIFDPKAMHGEEFIEKLVDDYSDAVAVQNTAASEKDITPKKNKGRKRSGKAD